MYAFIKTKGPEGARTGYFVSNMYRMSWRFGLKVFRLSYVKERLTGWTLWWVDNYDDYVQAVKTLEELKKARIFDYKVSSR